MIFIDQPSPNYNERGKYNINKIILHYTDMLSAQESLARLCDEKMQVSSHYLIDTNGSIYQLVEEQYRAWHAGISCWEEEENINASSIGIELQNKGQQFGYEEFPDQQIDALINLIKDIKQRHTIVKQNILAHSDIAPQRKIDPDYLFPWYRLAEHDLCILPQQVECDIPLSDLLDMIGYDITHGSETIKAFQRRYRPNKIDGIADQECQNLAMGIITQMERI